MLMLPTNAISGVLRGAVLNYFGNRDSVPMRDLPKAVGIEAALDCFSKFDNAAPLLRLYIANISMQQLGMCCSRSPFVHAMYRECSETLGIARMYALKQCSAISCYAALARAEKRSWAFQKAFEVNNLLPLFALYGGCEQYRADIVENLTGLYASYLYISWNNAMWATCPNEEMQNALIATHTSPDYECQAFPEEWEKMCTGKEEYAELLSSVTPKRVTS